MAKKTPLQKLAAEINEVMGLNPKLDVNAPEKELTKLVIKAIKLIEPDEDKFSDEGQALIDELVPPVKAEEEEEKPAKGKGKGNGKGKAEPEPEDEPEEADEPEEDSIEDQINDADDLDELREIMNENKEFKKAKDVLMKIKKLSLLKEAMLELVEGLKPKEEKPAKGNLKGNATSAGKGTKAPNFEKPEYSRIDAVCEALKTKPKTIQAWSDKADELIMKKGGKANPQENKSQIKKLSGFLKHFETGFTAPEK